MAAEGELVTDPEIIRQFQETPGGELVTDPDIIRQFQGIAPAQPRVFTEASRNPVAIAGRVLSAGAKGAAESFTEAGALGSERWSGLTRQISNLGDAIMRIPPAVMSGIADAAKQAAIEAGQDPGVADRLRRDVLAMPEAFAGMGPTLPPSVVVRAEAAAAPTAARAAPVAERTQAALQAAERLGVEVPTGAVGAIKPRVAGALADAPIVGGPLQAAAQRATAKLESTAAGIADDLGGATVQSAGDTVKDALTSWVKVASKDEARKIFEPVEAIVKDAKGPLSRTMVATKELAKEAAESGLPPPRIVGELQTAINMKDGLSYRAMQRLRIEVGDRLSGDIVPEPGLSKRALKVVYGALSEDIKFLMRREGGKAGEEAWRTANSRFESEIAARRDVVAKIVGAEGQASAETVSTRMLAMASARKGADIDRLTEARKVLGDSAWNELASAALGRMGASKDGWSLARWRTDYDRLSDAGKNLLFSAEHRAALDDINRVGREFENLAKLGNPSGTARMGLTVGGAGSFVLHPIETIAAGVGSWGLAKILARPAAAKATAEWVNAYSAANKSFTEATYSRLKRAGLDMRSAFDREGIEMLAIRPASITQQENPPSDQE